MIKKLLYSILLFVPATAFAAPNPTSYSLSGSAYGSELRVNGTAFGTKPTQKADAWYPFDSIFQLQPSTWGIITSGGTQNLVWVTSAPVSLENASGYAKFTWCDSCNDAGSGNPFGAISGGAYINKAAKWDQVDDSGFRYFDFSTTGNQKLFRINPGPSNFVVSTAGGGCCFNEGCAGVGVSDSLSGFPSNVWNFEEHHYKYGDTDNGEWTYATNSAIRQQHTNRDDCGLESDELRIWDNFTDTADTPADGVSMWQSGILVDSTRVRIIISTNSTYASSVRKIPQIPKQHSSTSTVCYFNDIGLDKTKQMYLYMVDDSGNANANGLAITAGASSGGTILNPQFTGVTTSSATASWGLVGSNTYNVVFATSSDFATPITSGTTTSGTTTFTSLNPGTTYMVQVKISTEDAVGYSSGSTVTYRTNLSPAENAAGRSASTLRFDWNTSMSVTISLSPAGSTGTITGNTTTYTNLPASTQQTFSIHSSTGGPGDIQTATGTTDAPVSGTRSIPPIGVSGSGRFIGSWIRLRRE